MKTYTVKEVSTMLDVNEETVRRWIRSGKLYSDIDNKKQGFVITELDLYLFADEHEKYRKRCEPYNRVNLFNVARKLFKDSPDLFAIFLNSSYGKQLLKIEGVY